MRCESEDPTSSCHLSQSCQLENPISLELEECSRDSAVFNGSALYDGFNITECIRHDDDYDHCHAAVPHTDYSERYFILHNVTNTLYPLNHEHFNMNVSWFYSGYDFGKASIHSIYPLVGYELRVKHGRDVLKCLCVWDTNLFKLSLRFNPKLMYGHSSQDILVAVSALPYKLSNSEMFFVKSETVAWPTSCNSELLVPHSLAYCPGPLQDSPQNIQFIYRTSEELQVSWSHPSVSPHPAEYYIYITDGQENYTILANKTRSIFISGLNSTQQYSVQVQAYSRCSGLSNSISGSGEGIGCGLLSDSISVRPLPIVTSHSFTTFTTPTVNISSTPPHHQPTHLRVFYIAITIPLIVFILLVLIIVVVIAVILHRIPKPISDDRIVHPKSSLKSDVLVLYSQNTPLEEQIFIQTYVVARIKVEGMSVRSCNDHNFEKTIAQWVEEQVRHSYNIFIICNKSFYKEWNSEKTPLLNSLETIISSAASHKNIDKYATILLGKRDKNMIPDNLYLKGMKSFVIGEDVKPKYMNEIVRFIKHNHSRH